MGFFDWLFGPKPPSWVSSASDHNGKSAEQLVEALGEYVDKGGGTMRLEGGTAYIEGPKGSTEVSLGTLSILCKRKNREGWTSMIALQAKGALRDEALAAASERGTIKELEKHAEVLGPLASDLEAARVHLRLTTSITGFLEEEAPLHTISKPLTDSHSVVVVYEMLRHTSGLPRTHVESWGVDDAALWDAASAGLLAEEVDKEESGGLTYHRGPFAGELVAVLGEVLAPSAHGYLVGAPHGELMVAAPVVDKASLTDSFEAVYAAVRREAGGSDKPPGGFYKDVFWWEGGRFERVEILEFTIRGPDTPSSEYTFPPALLERLS